MGRCRALDGRLRVGILSNRLRPGRGQTSSIYAEGLGFWVENLEESRCVAFLSTFQCEKSTITYLPCLSVTLEFVSTLFWRGCHVSHFRCASGSHAKFPRVLASDRLSEVRGAW